MARTRGCIWLAAGLVVAILAAVVAFITLNNAAQRPEPVTGTVAGGPTVSVVVATQIVPVRTLLAADMVEIKQLPVDAVPDGALGTLEGAVGKLTLAELYPGEVVLASRLADPNVVSGDGRVALVLSEDEVLLAFPAGDLMSRIGVLKAGDRVDLLFTLDFPSGRTTGAAGEGTERVTFNGLQNVAVAAIVASGQEGGPPAALLFTVSPQDALTLKYLKDAGAVVDIVLRAPGADQPYETEPVDVDLLIDKYQIPTEPGR